MIAAVSIGSLDLYTSPCRYLVSVQGFNNESGAFTMAVTCDASQSSLDFDGASVRSIGFAGDTFVYHEA